MNKISFLYTKPEEAPKQRNLLFPKYLKESANVLKDIGRDGVKYVQGYELDSSLTQEERFAYENAIREFHEREKQTLQQFLEERGLSGTKVTQKSFKKEQISDLKVLDAEGIQS